MGDLNNDADTLSMWDHIYDFADQKIKVHEDYDAGLGGTLFDGALCLCNYMEYLDGQRSRAYWKGLRIVELGAGCGLPGMLAASLGATVEITDIEETVELIEENVEENSAVIRENATPRVLDWNDVETLEACEPYDVILAADTVYSETAVPLFIRVLEKLSTSATEILFAHPKPRKEQASDLFWAEWERRGHEVLKVLPEHFGAKGEKGAGFYGRNGVFVLRCNSKNNDVVVHE